MVDAVAKPTRAEINKVTGGNLRMTRALEKLFEGLNLTSEAVSDQQSNLNEAVSDLSDDIANAGLSLSDVNNAISSHLSSNPIAGVFPIWAEENGAIASNAYEWSWGNGAVGSDIGIVLPMSCDLFAVTFNADVAGTSLTMRTQKNGTDAHISNHVGQNSVDTLTAPVRYAAGDVLAFRTGDVVGTYTDARVTAWLRGL